MDLSEKAPYATFGTYPVSVVKDITALESGFDFVSPL